MAKGVGVGIRVLVFFLISFAALGQSSGAHVCSHAKIRSLQKARLAEQTRYPGDSLIDVTYHKIDININVPQKTISSVVTTTFIALANISKVSFDLRNELKVTSVSSGGVNLPVSHTSNKVAITLPDGLEKGKALTVKIAYEGTPPANSFGSFTFGTYGSAKRPVVWTLSEPYGAPDWWPCKDDPKDKIDSVDVLITLPKAFKAVSNGLVVSEKLNGELKTTHWKSRYPIAHYLISLACAEYEEYPQVYEYSGGKMPIQNYVYPGELNLNVISNLKQVPFMLEYFSNIFGEYPFIKEKYGHAMFGFGGGMEHQTVSSMGTFFEDLVVHELAHQWYGDKITCATWSDIFMNEAFATYSEALWQENRYGKAEYKKYIADYMISAKRTGETIYISDIKSEGLIFDYNLSYAKGAVVLHMLRGVLGDKSFFEVLKAFQASGYAYQSATIFDFRIFIEKITGQNLKYFFDEWVYDSGYPGYLVTWYNLPSNALKIEVVQTKSKIFKMPMQVKLRYKDGSEEIKTLFIEKPDTDFVLSGLKGEVTGVVFDPENWILMDLQVSQLLSNEPGQNLKIYPNPVSESLKISEEQVPDNIEISDVLGKKYSGYSLKSGAVNVSGLMAGKYFIKLTYKDKEVVRSFEKVDF